MISKLLLSPLLTPEQCRGRVSEADMVAAQSFCLTRAAEYLTWRAVLADYLGYIPTISYTHQGAPQVEGQSIYIGVSHTVDLVAVVVSESRCAVDVERKDRDVSRVSSRFLTGQEMALCSTKQEQVVLWCARECYYKLRQDSTLSLLTDIRVASLDLEAGVVTVVDSRAQSATFRVEQAAEHFVVYII
jgi:phosphopantetheinyl transferase